MGKTQRTNTGAKVLIISAFCFVFVLFLSLFRMMFLGEQAEAEHNLESPSRVVFLGTSGVSWDILDPVSAPNLFAAATAKSAEIANFIVKINADTACPDAGWLTVNTGVRTNGLADFSMRCRTFPQVNQIEGQWQIANWEQYPEVNSANKYRPIFGNLAQVLSGNGKKSGQSAPEQHSRLPITTVNFRIPRCTCQAVLSRAKHRFPNTAAARCQCG
ncbi:hypothetical protein RQN30_08090 [Arcanobacterium hippocoleae]